MKKVLFTATVDSHIKHFHIPYLKYFKEQGYEVHVATNGFEDIEYCDVKHVISFERSPLKINNLKAIKQLKKIIEDEKFDIIHCHTPMGGVATRIAAMKARKKYGTKVIYTAHGFHFYKGAPLQNWLIFYPIEKYLSKYTDCLITINGEDYDLAKKKFKCRTEYIPGVGVDENKFKFEMSEEEKVELRKSIGLEKDDFVMIYPAELSKRKNQSMLISVMEKLIVQNPKIKLILPGLDSMNGLYQKSVIEKGLEKNILFLGYRTDIPQLIKISNIGVSSACQEGLPVNIMEAMISGLPIIATNCRGNRDLVENGKNGYIVPIDDVEAMTEKIMELSLLKLTGNDRLTKKYTLDSIIKEMDKIYSIYLLSSKPSSIIQDR